MKREVTFLPAVTVTVEDGQVVNVGVDWGDSLEDAADEGLLDVRTACGYLDDETRRDRVASALAATVDA